MSLFTKDLLKDNFTNGTENVGEYGAYNYYNNNGVEGSTLTTADQNGYNNFGAYSGHTVGQVNQSRASSNTNVLFQSSGLSGRQIQSQQIAPISNQPDNSVPYFSPLQTPPRNNSTTTLYTGHGSAIGSGSAIGGGGSIGSTMLGFSSGGNRSTIGDANSIGSSRSLISSSNLQSIDSSTAAVTTAPSGYNTLSGGNSYGLGSQLRLGSSKPEEEYSAFKESDDFPALPSSHPKPDGLGILGGSSGGYSSLNSGSFITETKTGLLGSSSLASTTGTSGGLASAGSTISLAGSTLGSSKDLGKYGLAGLMEITRGTEKDHHVLAMGTDLTTFGLNLNSAESLYVTFTSPFADSSQSDPQFNTPQCFLMHPPALKAEHLSKFNLETLFYMFYQLPKDILQACAAQELYQRDWRYHGELKIWVKDRSTPDVLQSQYLYFDTKSWEVHLLNPAQVRGNLKAGFIPEEEIRVKVPLPGLAPIVEPS